MNRTSFDGLLIYADINASLNITRKVIPAAFGLVILYDWRIASGMSD
ncbi:hypothetical protein H6H01_24830 [Nostoc calcicola FACHB-3891]|nr:hypothetical protein [Nostoc calcicola FACHB-3891]